MKKMIVIALTFVISACATSYQKDGFTGGYEETWMSSDIVKVDFAGNGYTSSTRTADFSMLRVAELAIEKGYPYFELLNQSSDSTTHTTPVQHNVSRVGNQVYVDQTGGHTFTKPSSSNLAKFYMEKPAVAIGVIYESKFICNSIKAKHDLKEVSCM